MITWKGGKIGWYVTTSRLQADFSWLGCICKQFLLEIVSTQWGFLYLIAARDTLALIDVSWVHRPTFEDVLPPIKFVGGEALDCKGSRICSVVDGSYPFRGTAATDVCRWAWPIGQCQSARIPLVVTYMYHLILPPFQVITKCHLSALHSWER